MIKYIFIIDSYVFIFTVTTYVQGVYLQDENKKASGEVENYNLKTCNVVTGIFDIDEYLYVIKRICEFAIWQLPMIYIFFKRVNKTYKPKRKL
jgi:hypothetical protein